MGVGACLRDGVGGEPGQRRFGAVCGMGYVEMIV